MQHLEPPGQSVNRPQPLRSSSCCPCSASLTFQDGAASRTHTSSFRLPTSSSEMDRDGALDLAAAAVLHPSCRWLASCG